MSNVKFIARIVLSLSCSLLAFPALALATHVHGRVTAYDTGLPLAGATLSISQFGIVGYAEIARTTTTADGEYAWDGSCLAPFTGMLCRVRAIANGYVDSDVFFDPDTNTDVLADFSLHRAATVRGTVRFAANAAPAAGAAVRIECVPADACPQVIQAVTASDGTYSASGFPAGTYRICTSALYAGTIAQCYDHLDHDAFAIAQPYVPITLSDGQTRTSVDFDLAFGGSIAGTLREDFTHDVLAGYATSLSVYDENGALFEETTVSTDDNGSYVLDGLPSGTYYLKASAEDAFEGPVLYPDLPCAPADCPPASGCPLTVASGTTMGGIDFTFHPVAVVSGTVTDALTGAPLGGIPIRTAHCDLMWGGCVDDFNGAVSAPGTGTYALFLAQGSGRYIVTANDRPYIDQVYPAIPCVALGACTEYGQLITPVSGDRIANVDFSLGLGASIGGAAMDIVPGSNAFVSVTLMDATHKIIARLEPDESGHYEGPAWLAGTYYAQAHADSACTFYEHASCPYPDDNPSQWNATPIVLQQGEVHSDIDFQLDSADPIFRDGFGQ